MRARRGSAPPTPPWPRSQMRGTPAIARGEGGSGAACAAMAGVPDGWDAGDRGVEGVHFAQFGLRGAPGVHVLFWRLCDGCTPLSRSGPGPYTIPRLWLGEERSIPTVDG